MKVEQYYKGHRIELFTQKASDETWLCRAKIDGEWMDHHERGIRKADAQKKALATAKGIIDLCVKLEGRCSTGQA